VATAKQGGYVHLPRTVEGQKVRESPTSFADHFSQAALFYRSMTEVEQTHIIEAYTFELGKCAMPEIRERYLTVLAAVDADLCRAVADGLGLPAPKGKPPRDVTPSPALSMITLEPGPIAGRVVGVLAVEGSDLAGISRLRKALNAEGAVLRVLSDRGGTLGEGRNEQLIERTLLTTRSIEYDALLVADGAGELVDIKLTLLLHEMHRHSKALGAWGDGQLALEAARIDPAAPGILTAPKAGPDLISLLVEALGRHRAWDRAELVLSSAVPPVH
jgi:catalase